MKQPTKEYSLALETGADCWVPANGGHEEPFFQHGKKWLYVWNPATGSHGYLDMGTDIVQREKPE